MAAARLCFFCEGSGATRGVASSIPGVVVSWQAKAAVALVFGLPRCVVLVWLVLPVPSVTGSAAPLEDADVFETELCAAGSGATESASSE